MFEIYLSFWCHNSAPVLQTNSVLFPALYMFYSFKVYIISLEVVHSHSHGSGFVLLQVLLWSDNPGVWEQRPVTLPELLDVTLVVHDLQYRDTTGQKSHDTGRKFCMLQKLTLALNFVNRQNIFQSWRLLKLFSAWATVRNIFLVSKLPKTSWWIPQIVVAKTILTF